uniref:Uncharacterized protein n=1 Tax=Utricularia reniformis TaxID=192314 RepID=A0A1Y0AZ25_9LAMI|nr:hypothetical protein AEK19_MT1303 [Utricularia reniformis]ART30369.1 hypothetical protein AEK19_MT1303 [Utricularia reniformis]
MYFLPSIKGLGTPLTAPDKESSLSSIRSKHCNRTAIKQSIRSYATSTAHSPSLVSPVFCATFFYIKSSIIGRVHWLYTNPIVNFHVYTRISPLLSIRIGAIRVA